MLRYYLSVVNLNRCTGGCDISYLSNRICVPNKTEDLNLNVFNMGESNESKILTKHFMQM